jgi:Putative zinc-finger
MDHGVYDVEAYVLGCLDPEEAQQFEKHLSSCAQCQANVASFVPVLQGLRTIAPPSPPPLVLPPRRTWTLPRALQVAAAVVLITLGAIGGMRYQQGQTDDMVMVAAMSATSKKEVRLAGLHAEGRAIVGMAGGRTAFVLFGLPPPRTGVPYEVWIRGKGISSAGTLRRTNDGYEVLVVQGNLLDGAHDVRIKSGDETVASGTV